MDVDRARTQNLPRHCGEPGHLARDCPTPANIRSLDVVDEVIQQLGGDLLEELVARLATTQAVEERATSVETEDFRLRNE